MYSIKFDDLTLFVYLNSKIYKIQDENILELIRNDESLLQNEWLQIDVPSSSTILNLIYRKLVLDKKEKVYNEIPVYYQGNNEEIFEVLKQLPAIDLVGKDEQYLCRIIDEADYLKIGPDDNNYFLIILSEFNSIVKLGDVSLPTLPNNNQEGNSKLIMLARSINVVNNLRNSIENMVIVNSSNIAQMQEIHYQLDVKNDFIPCEISTDLNVNDNINEICDKIFKLSSKYFEPIVDVSFGELKQIPYNIVGVKCNNRLSYIVAETPFEVLKKAYQKAFTEALEKLGLRGYLCDLADSYNLNMTRCRMIYNFLQSENFPIRTKKIDLKNIQKYHLESIEHTLLENFLENKTKISIIISKLEDFCLFRIEIVKEGVVIFELFGIDFENLIIECYKYIVATAIQNSYDTFENQRRLDTAKIEDLSIVEYNSLLMRKDFDSELKKILSDLNKEFLYFKWDDKNLFDNTGMSIGKIELVEG